MQIFTINLLSNKKIWIITILVIIANYLLAFVSPPLHDYLFYQNDWDKISNGEFITTTYGPIYYLLAFLYKIHPKLPHLLSLTSWALSSCYILNLFLYKNFRQKLILIWILLFINPLFIFYISYYGSIDGFLISFLLFGIVFYDKRQHLKSSIMLSLGILLKLIPLFIIPFLLFRQKKNHFLLLVYLTIFIFFGFLISYIFFDINFVTNFSLQAHRLSVTLSFFRFLRGDFSPIHLFSANPNLDFISIYLIIGSLLFLFFIHIKYNFNYLISTALALTLTLSLHIVGNHQYYISLIYVFIFLIYKNSQINFILKKHWVKVLTLPIFISLIPLIEFLIRKINFSFKRNYYDDLIGLFLFISSITTIIFLFKLGYENFKKSVK